MRYETKRVLSVCDRRGSYGRDIGEGWVESRDRPMVRCFYSLHLIGEEGHGDSCKGDSCGLRDCDLSPDRRRCSLAARARLFNPLDKPGEGYE